MDSAFSGYSDTDIGRKDKIIALLILSLFILLNLIAVPGSSQTEGSVQVLTGHLDPGEIAVYTLPSIMQGQTLYVYAAGTSGDLDPFTALADAKLNARGLNVEFLERSNRQIAEGMDPLGAARKVANSLFLIWNDDMGEGYTSAFKYSIPSSGSYQLIVASSPAKETFGDYTLILGIDAPQVLNGQSEPTGQTLAFLNTSESSNNMGVQELRGNITAKDASDSFWLRKMRPGDTLYASVETASGNLSPIIALEDYGYKTICVSNWTGTGAAGSATMQYTFQNYSQNDRLTINMINSSRNDGGLSTGSYRLLVGLNDPEALINSTKSRGDQVLLEPIMVRSGLMLDQITEVNQKSENFAIVASLWLSWNDPDLAFNPEICQCGYKVYHSINQFVEKEKRLWPEFTIYNQQGKRNTQNQIIVIYPDGEALYFERFWVTLQAPDFDFTKYPLDQQKFHVKIDSLYPQDSYVFVDWPEMTGVGPQLGEEEWSPITFGTEIGNTRQGILDSTSRISFYFLMQRHLYYYVMRIFLPILIIIFMSWLTFSLKDYEKRSDMAGANLLLFIAFNFTIASDLPRLGYLTFMDMVIAISFAIASLVFAYNMYLRWLQSKDKTALVERLDRVAIWLYPLAYLAAIGLAYISRL